VSKYKTKERLTKFTIGKDSPTGDELKKIQRRDRRLEAIGKLRQQGWKVECFCDTINPLTGKVTERVTMIDDNSYADGAVYWILMPPYPHAPVFVRTTDDLERKASGL
jgi:hypothetical protein